MPWNQLVDRARECGVSEPELMVLGVVRYATPMRVDHMPAWALKEFKDVGTSYDEVDLEVAVENCIEKGWLRVLTERDIGRHPPDHSAFDRYNRWSPGVMDFTPEGFALVSRVFLPMADGDAPSQERLSGHP